MSSPNFHRKVRARAPAWSVQSHALWYDAEFEGGFLMRLAMTAALILLASAVSASGTSLKFSPVHPQPLHTRGLNYCGDGFCGPRRDQVNGVCKELGRRRGDKLVLDKPPFCWCICTQ